MIAAAVAMGAATAAAETADAWPSVQGGPAHLGVAASADPAPPLRTTWSLAPGDGGPGFSAATVGEGVGVTVGRATVVGFDPASGAVRWRVGRASGYLDPAAIGRSASGPPVAVFAQGRAGAASSILALDLDTRAEVWRYPAHGSLRQPLRGSPAIVDGVVYVGGMDGSVYALDLGDGHLVWRFAAGGQVAADPAVDGGRVFAAAQDPTTGHATLYAIDATTGKQAWAAAAPGPSSHLTAPTVADGTVFEGFGDGTIRAFEASTGRVEWTASIRGVFLSGPSLASAGGSLYAFAPTGAVYRLDAGTGDKVWDYQFPTTSVRGAPILVGGYLIVGLDDGTLGVIDLRSGNLAWTTELANRKFGPFAWSDGLLIASSVGTEGSHGGLLALHHVEGRLTAIESPTRLHLGTALVNASVGVATVFAGFFVLFGAILGRRTSARAVLASGEPTGGDPWRDRRNGDGPDDG